jgi:hypothetical protein
MTRSAQQPQTPVGTASIERIRTGIIGEGQILDGPYGHRLLGIDPQRSHAFRDEIGHGCEGVKPGRTGSTSSTCLPPICLTRADTAPTAEPPPATSHPLAYPHRSH